MLRWQVGWERTVEIDCLERGPHTRGAGTRRGDATNSELALPVPPPADYASAVDERARVLVAGRQRYRDTICEQVRS